MTYEELTAEAVLCGLEVIELPLYANKGRIVGSNIAIKQDIPTLKEKACILAEELGHHFTTVGNILNQNISENRKQEYRARLWAYDKQIGLVGIVQAFEKGCQSLYEMAEFLDVTEEFLLEALSCYKSKYGLNVSIDSYIVYFEPCLAVMKMGLY